MSFRNILRPNKILGYNLIKQRTHSHLSHAWRMQALWSELKAENECDVIK